MLIDRSQILQLYKELFKYGQLLKYTDKKYYFEKIRTQFLNFNNTPEQTQILYKVNSKTETKFQLLLINICFGVLRKDSCSWNTNESFKATWK